jgi:hypothetical protein
VDGWFKLIEDKGRRFANPPLSAKVPVTTAGGSLRLGKGQRPYDANVEQFEVKFSFNSLVVVDVHFSGCWLGIARRYTFLLASAVKIGASSKKKFEEPMS